MKWTGGPVVARAVISSFRQFENCSPLGLRTAVAGFALFNVAAYWKELPPRFDALAIFLEHEEWLVEPRTVAGRSHGASWIVLPDSEATSKWMTTLVTISPNDSRGSRAASPALRFTVFRRDSYSCQYCGRRAPEFQLHVDHIVPWSRGGKTEIANLRTACSECNLGKSDREA